MDLLLAYLEIAARLATLDTKERLIILKKPQDMEQVGLSVMAERLDMEREEAVVEEAEAITQMIIKEETAEREAEVGIRAMTQVPLIYILGM